MAHLVEHALRALRAHACRWESLPEVTVPSAAVSDDDTRQWSDDMYARDLANEPEPRTGEQVEIRTLRRLGVALVALIAAAVLSTGVARADGVVSDVEAQYILVNADAVCLTLDKYPTKAGVLGVMQGVMDHGGFSPDSAVDVINASVYEMCPQHWPLLQRIGAEARARNALAEQRLI